MKGLLIVLSGSSGAGKGTVLKNILERKSDLKCSISVTTRNPRPNEIDGVNYFFKTIEEYKNMVENDMFLECQEVYGNYYGTPIEYVNSLREEGIDVVLEIDIKGAFYVKERASDALMIFLTPKDKTTLEQRLIGRQTETAESLSTRLMAAEKEIQEAKKYDYLVINDDVERCAEDVLAIIRAEKCKVSKKTKFIESFR